MLYIRYFYFIFTMWTASSSLAQVLVYKYSIFFISVLTRKLLSPAPVSPPCLTITRLRSLPSLHLTLAGPQPLPPSRQTQAKPHPLSQPRHAIDRPRTCLSPCLATTKSRPFYRALYPNFMLFSS
jgi:hypothetical protein